MNERLSAIGDALELAVAADLRSAGRRRWRWRSPRVAAAAVVAVIAIPAVAYAATSLLSTSQVAASLPQGTKALIGTDPTCTVVTANVEYHCVLASAPSSPYPPSAQSPGAPSKVPFSNPIRVRVVESDGQTVIVSATSASNLKHTLAKLGVRRVVQVTVIQQYGHGAASEPAATVTLTGTTPATRTTPGAFNWTGTTEVTVDASKHVNGGCRAVNAIGTSWECYIGEAAVKQKLISQGFLGQYAPAPGVG
ncbi:MAG: hypothetical protein ACRDKL_06515 [Solirubrobacteraceae bacterium]